MRVSSLSLGRSRSRSRGCTGGHVRLSGSTRPTPPAAVWPSSFPQCPAPGPAPPARPVRRSFRCARSQPASGPPGSRARRPEDGAVAEDAEVGAGGSPQVAGASGREGADRIPRSPRPIVPGPRLPHCLLHPTSAGSLSLHFSPGFLLPGQTWDTHLPALSSLPLPISPVPLRSDGSISLEHCVSLQPPHWPWAVQFRCCLRTTLSPETPYPKVLIEICFLS